MIKKVISSTLSAVLILTLTACAGNRYYDLETVVSTDVEEGLRAIEATRKALSNLGIDVDDLDSSYGAAPEPKSEPEPTEKLDKPGRKPYKGKYTAISWGNISDLSLDGEVKGNYFYTPAQVLSFWKSDDGIEHYLLSIEYGFMTVMRGEVNEGWRDIKVGDAINIYFRYIGSMSYFDFDEPPQGDEYFTKYLDMVDHSPYGSYEYYEPYIF